MLKRVKEFVKGVVEIVEARHSVNMFHVLETYLDDVDGVHLYKDDLFVFACMGVKEANAVAIPDKNIVVINEAALNLPSDLLNALISHEIGHLKLGHKINSLYPIQAFVGFGNGLKCELEADAYAISKGEKTVELLEYMYSKHNTRCLAKRIQAARKLCNMEV